MRRSIGVAAVLALASCGGSAEPDGVASTVADEHEENVASPAPGGPTDAGDRALVDLVVEGIEQLLAVPAVSITVAASEGDADSAFGSALVQRDEGKLRSSFTIVGPNSDTTTDRIVLADEMYVRFVSDSTEPPDWTRLEIDDRTAAEFIDESFTAFGTLGASLDRIVELSENVPVIVTDLGERTDGGIAAQVIELSFSAVDVAAYLRENQLERVGPTPPHGAVVYEFWVDGHLLRLVGGGTQFHDGEPIEGVETSVGYRISQESGIEPPQASGIVIES